MNASFSLQDELSPSLSKDRYSATTCSSNSLEEGSEGDFCFEGDLIPPIQDLRFQLFENPEEGGEITQKMSQRAVSWVITLCWTKNLDRECLWSTLLLFYCLRSQRHLRKDQLEITLLACLSLSVKLNSPRTLSLKEISCLSSKPTSPASIIQAQSIILTLLSFNPLIPHYLTSLAQCSLLSSQQVDKLEFLCQLLLVKGSAIFFNRERLELLVRIIAGLDSCSFTSCREEREELKQLLTLKQCKIIINKYSTRFDVEALIALIN